MSEAVDDPTADDRTAGDAPESIVGDERRLGEIDLVGIEADLDGVQAALVRLADGTYWSDEVTGEAIGADVLAADPMARRA